MPIYNLTIKGRNKPVLVKADSQAKAKDIVVKAEALSAEEMQVALENGDRVWNGDGDLPADEPAEGEGSND